MMIRRVRIQPIQKVFHSVGKSEYRSSAYQKLKIKKIKNPQYVSPVIAIIRCVLGK